MIAPSAYAPGAQTVVKTASIDATRLPAIYCFIFTSLLIVSRLVRCLRQHPRYTPHPHRPRVLYHFSAHARQLIKQLFRACVLYQNERSSGFILLLTKRLVRKVEHPEPVVAGKPVLPAAPSEERSTFVLNASRSKAETSNPAARPSRMATLSVPLLRAPITGTQSYYSFRSPFSALLLSWPHTMRPKSDG